MTTLLFTAAMVGTIHTLMGPDHYVPFVAMAKAGRWTTSKTLLITVLCGLGHVIGSIALGAIGITFGWAIEPLEAVEGTRGSIAGWLLIGFGLAYLVWGLRKLWRKNERVQSARVDGKPGMQKSSMIPWILFTIFVLGPCEPLIPLLMFPAAQHSVYGIAMVAAVFSICTIATMTTVVMLMHRGLSWVSLPWLERNTQVLSGAAICACGLAVQFGL